MDRTFLRHYNDELQYVREMSAEFAAEYPKIAGRLGLDPTGKEACADPFVERLLEGFAFLTARVQHKFGAEFPRFTQAMLETVYPHYLAPTPSMLVARFDPDLADGGLAAGFRLPRDLVLRSMPGKNERTACEYRTAHAVTLWPLKLTQAQYYTRDLGALSLGAAASGVRAALRLRFEVTGGATGGALGAMAALDLYLRGTDEFPVRVYEQLVARQAGAVVRPVEQGKVPPARPLPKPAVTRAGMEEDEAMLPTSPRTFSGYRLMQEYLAFPQRFLFVRLHGIGPALAGSASTAFDVIVLLTAADDHLEGRVDEGSFALFATPAVNLVRRRADRIALSSRDHENLVLTDRTRPLDFEVYRVEKVTGLGTTSEEQQAFHPFYLSRHQDPAHGAFFTARRVPRLLTQKERRFGKATSYAGSEVYLSIVDAASAPYRTGLKQLAVEALVTNRHLPLTMATGLERGDFTTEGGGPLKAIRCITGPTPPRPAWIEGDLLWRIVSHLSLNYFSIVGDGRDGGPVPFREILRLYADPGDRVLQKQIDGVVGIGSRPVVRRAPGTGPVTFIRGTEMTLRLDDTAFEGIGVFLLGSVAERFLAKYASINSFTETVVVSTQRGELMRWPPQAGQRPLL